VIRPCLGLVVSVGWGAGLALTPLSAPGQTADPDGERSAWHFRRSVGLTSAGSGPTPSFAALPLPPDVGARCQPQLEDARLVAADGHEVPYVVDRVVERERQTAVRGRLVDTRTERKQRTVWMVDLGEPRDFDDITLEIHEQDFVKRILVEASDDAQSWRTLRPDAGVFDRPWNVRVHHTSIAFPERTRARYLRLSADDRRSKPVVVTGVTVWTRRRLPAEAWERPVELKPAGSGGGVSRYLLELPPSFPLERLELASDDPAFSRRVVLYEVHGTEGQGEKAALGEALLYRLQIEDEALSGESRVLPVRRGHSGELVLEIHDGDSPPLRNLRVLASAPATRLLFPAFSGPLTLYYANEATRAPAYDLETLKGRIGLAPLYAPAALGPEVENPRYQKPPPLPFAASRGAPLEVARWRATRLFAVSGHEDLYSLTLAGEDLGLLRDDLGDVRIVDEEGRQVPYVLEPMASEARVTLALTKEPGATSERRAVTRWRLAVTSTSGTALPLPFAAIELRFGDVFFARPARLLTAPGSGGGGVERAVFSGTLAAPTRRPAARPGGDGPGFGGATDPEPIVLVLDGARQGVFFLDINEGDNVPLTLLQCRGVVRVPRLAFKASPGSYRILLGNGGAGGPRYDIATLRHEILAYSALPLQAAGSVPNPAFRRRARDYLQDAPPALVLWGTLLAAVAALLFLTARILRQPADPTAP
jgi:hypothetical protein